jgi:aspartyl-tRNA(Asn)/glutamyl-tRNA(Gln) amidotransferase subunit B
MNCFLLLDFNSYSSLSSLSSVLINIENKHFQMSTIAHEKYEAVIGLEVHAQLLTESKAFAPVSTEFGGAPNTQVTPLCLGHPGTLPVLNENLVRYTIKMGLATNCKVAEKSIFARKNYFYPDLPKGYQISQYETPICYNGEIHIDMEEYEKTIGLTRIHMEEDAGKSIHDQDPRNTLVDLNRAGVPLIEIVSEPDIRTPQEAYAYLTKIKQIVQYLEICDGNMEEGSLRCDANVSVRPRGQKELGTRTELKNMNSFRNVERAIQFEIERQIELIEAGGEVVQQTLLWDANKMETRQMRSKEEAHDYRYFPEPDIPP